MGGVAHSNFRFLAYKIDKAKLEALPHFKFLKISGPFKEELWRFNISFRRPVFFTKSKEYVGGLDVELVLGPPESDAQGKPNPPPLVALTMGIAGVFSVDDERFDSETELDLVRTHIPALLMPYIRAAVTGLLSLGGYGGFNMPLINIRALAKEKLEGFDVEVVEA